MFYIDVFYLEKKMLKSSILRVVSNWKLNNFINKLKIYSILT